MHKSFIYQILQVEFVPTVFNQIMFWCTFAAFDVNAFGMTRNSVRNLNFNDVYFGSRLANDVNAPGRPGRESRSADAISKAINQDRARRPLPELLPVPVYIGVDLGSMARTRHPRAEETTYRRHFLLAPARGAVRVTNEDIASAEKQ